MNKLALALLLLAPFTTQARVAPSLPLNALPVPLIPQSTDYSCGPASLFSVLLYWHAFDGHETDLFKMLGTNKKNGTEPEALTEGARKFGLDAQYIEDMTLEELRSYLDRGYTSIVDLQAWRSDGGKHPGKQAKTPWTEDWDDGHYVVLVGLDQHYAYFMDPSSHGGYAWIPIPELLDRWHDADNLHGKLVKFYHLAVVIRGKTPMKSMPGPLIRME